MFRWFLALTAVAIAVTGANADFTVTVYPSIGPFNGGDPFYNSYIANASAGLAQGGTSSGINSSPGYYQPAGSGTNSYSINGINTANGASPATGVYGLSNGVITTSPSGPNAGTLGNGFYFGVVIKGNSRTSTLVPSDVTFSGFTSPNSPGLGSFFTPTTANLGSVIGSPGLYGINANTNAYEPVTNDTTPYSTLYYTGFAGSITNIAGSDYTDPTSLNNLIAFSTPGGDLVGSYTVSNVNGTDVGFGDLSVNESPAPATIVLMGLGLSGIVARVRRRNAA